MIEYNSDSDTDAYNVRNNDMYEVSINERDRSPLPPRRQPSQVPRQRNGPEANAAVEQNNGKQQQPMEEDDQPELQEEVEEQEHQGPWLEDEHQQQQQQQVDEQEHQQQQQVDEQGLWIQDDDSGDEENLEPNEDYDTVYEKLKSEWILAEIDHRVSKTASEAFWKIGLMYFPKIHAALGRRKKIPQFKSVRNKMYEDLVPPVDLEIGYKDKSTGEISVVKDSVTPLKRFPASKYEKIYEIGTLKVSHQSKFLKYYFNFIDDVVKNK